MAEVLRALHELNVSWKKNGHYNMKCKQLIRTPQPEMDTHGSYNFSDGYSSIGNGHVAGRLYNEIKFEIQVCFFFG
jgi:5'-AMP-activated protein kinase, catalytic alpha subunit